MTFHASRRELFLDEMRLGPVWRQRMARPDVADDLPQDLSANFSVTAAPIALRSAPADPGIEATDWAQLKAAVAACARCDLCQSRTQTVFGSGNARAKWLIIGEGPGRAEDGQGEPFVGACGKLLDNMLLAMGLGRNGSEANAYIANIVKCRPTDATGRDRPPTAQETATCLPYLLRQIALIDPVIIVALGKTAALALLGLDPGSSLASLRGRVHQLANLPLNSALNLSPSLPLIVTHHPAYLLRNPEDKAQAWRDLRLAMTIYARLEPAAC